MNEKTTIAIAISFCAISTLCAAQAAQQPPPTSGTNLGAVTGGVFKEAHMVIDKKCVSCHSAERIEKAIASGRDMQKIQHRMELKGAKLTADEQTVLGIFYRESPLKPKK